MRMPKHLWLLNLLACFLWVPVFAQAQSADTMRIAPAIQRERDATRLNILQDELAKETRELDAAQTELRTAETSRTASAMVQEITAHVVLHRQNVATLEREIALVDRPINSAIRVTVKRQPDDWLIPGQRLAVAKLNDVQARRRLPMSAPEVKQPAWIIQSGLTGMAP